MEGIAKAAPTVWNTASSDRMAPVRWIDTRGQFQCDSNGSRFGLSALRWILLSASGAERDLRESEAYFHGLADATPHLVWTARA
jgi:hypothetical protein